MSTNEKLYESAIEAIRDLFSDKTVLPQATRTNLEAIKDEIDILLDTIKNES